jgi:hypothetical protein
VPREGLPGCGETGECRVRITALGVVVVVAIGIVAFVLWQQSNLNQGPQPDQSNENTH